ncbi:sigma-70 family RNA polymerase sigma factor [Vibrio alginolyticus]|nr:sigma-70 family RNA polymerase sigma factor [Vibrio alginolyticus]EMC8464530.1 sigma-70 family RNA polymerase sigma factor [Vibrio alginolyticus]EME3938355.1 sigma-70 family RNA polymerase sigma factor [Vibrio alginolyticus]
MSIYSQKSTDKELFVGSVKGSSLAFSILGKRYEPKLKAILNRSLKSIENNLSYSVDVLYEDFKSMVLADLLRKPIDSLRFDENDSIGGLIDHMAKKKAIDMYIRTENHRSEESTESRKKKDKEKQTAIQESLLSEEERLVEIETSTKKFDYGFHEFDEKEIDGLYINNPERAYIAEDIKVKFINMLSSVQSRIVELRAKGVTQNEIAKETGLTKDQVRTHLKKIDIIASEIQMDN